MTQTELKKLKKALEGVHAILEAVQSMEKRHEKMAFNSADERSLAMKIRQLKQAHSRFINAGKYILPFVM